MMFLLEHVMKSFPLVPTKHLAWLGSNSFGEVWSEVRNGYVLP